MRRTIEWYRAHEDWWAPKKAQVEAAYAAKGAGYRPRTHLAGDDGRSRGADDEPAVRGRGAAGLSDSAYSETRWKRR